MGRAKNVLSIFNLLCVKASSFIKSENLDSHKPCQIKSGIGDKTPEKAEEQAYLSSEIQGDGGIIPYVKSH